MNCLEFRRCKLADPRRLPPAAADHAEGCQHCRNFARRIDDQEARLARELTLPVPEGLADRVLMGLRERRRPQNRLRALLARLRLISSSA